MKNLIHTLLLLLTAVLLLGTEGCSTPPTDDDVYSKRVIGGFFASPQDPRKFGLTVYRSRFGPVFSGSKRIHPNQVAEEKFKSPSNTSFPIVEARGRKPIMIPTLIDTASRDSWANLTAADAIMSDPLGPPPYKRYADYVDDPAPGYACYVSKLRVGDVHVENAILYVRIPNITLGALRRNAEDPEPDMVLGCNLLKQFAFVRFDYPEHKLYISSSRGYKTNPSYVLADVPYKKVNGVFAVETLLDGKKQQVIIDSAGDFEIAWNKPDGTPIDQLFIGDLCIQDARITNSKMLPMGHPEIPRIGMRLLRRFALIIDNKRHHIILERPTESIDEDPEDLKEDALNRRREVNQILSY